ncbi:hypothetical protein [Ferribacterium limneticum]|nr:hypothetical protein [Ferribacterium limneticum]
MMCLSGIILYLRSEIGARQINQSKKGLSDANDDLLFGGLESTRQ